MPIEKKLEQTFGEHRRFLLQLARAQLRNNQLADDVVQETALAAWQSIHRFEQRASMRTWLVGILRFKIIDALRDLQKHPINLSAMEVDDEQHQMGHDLLFDAQGRWQDVPRAWDNEHEEMCSDRPDALLETKQMMTTLQACLDNLPPRTGQIFLMREYLGFEAAEIASQTDLETGHIRVILMRARLALRTCLELRF